MESRYLHNGGDFAAQMLKKARAEVTGPNLEHLLNYHKHLQIAGRDPRTLARQLRELRFILKTHGKKDMKLAGDAEIKELILAITRSNMAAISKRKHLLTLRVFVSFLLFINRLSTL